MDKLFGGLVGILDPEIRKLAEKMVEGVPKNSFFRSEKFERILGIFKGWLESKSKGKSPGMAMAIEKFTDFLNFVGVSLSVKTCNDAGSGKKEKKVVEIADDWMSSFFKEASDRIAKSSDPKTEFARLKEEFELRLQILELVKKAQEEAQSKQEVFEPAEPRPEKSWDELFVFCNEKFNEFYRRSDKATAEALWNFYDLISPKKPKIKRIWHLGDWFNLFKQWWLKRKKPPIVEKVEEPTVEIHHEEKRVHEDGKFNNSHQLWKPRGFFKIPDANIYGDGFFIKRYPGTFFLPEHVDREEGLVVIKKPF
ncbi:hypothetical protein HZC33_01250 [Candidatus Wolfebacteria bacterium]|nr:hypothetical protein [Candidatus Wolfebacteria bacterium]